MAVHDQERRTVSGRMHDARNRYDESSAGSKTLGFLIGFALIGFIVYMLFAAGNPTTTGDAVRQTPQNPTTTTTPRTTETPAAPTTQPK
jgi:hypothetical protein